MSRQHSSCRLATPPGSYRAWIALSAPARFLLAGSVILCGFAGLALAPLAAQSPASIVVRDDFTAPPLDPAWSFVDPVGDSTYSLTANPGHLQISVPSGSVHDCWEIAYDSCARMLRLVTDGDAVYETKIDGLNISTAYQAYGIFISQDPSNFLRLEYWTIGGGVFVDAWQTIAGRGSQAISGPSVSLGAANYLRVTRTGDTWQLEYSSDGASWLTAGSFTQALTVNAVGMSVANSANASTTANFDYFSITQGSADTTPPTVSITAPADNSTVSGNLTVSADATDDVAVAGVQFKVDGFNIGSEVTTPPYSISLDTTALVNGPHVLTAVARDTSNNTATSAPINITVNNPALVISNVTVGNVTSNSAAVAWNTNQPANSQVDYGTTTSYGQSTTLDSTLVTTHAQTISGLQPNTTYHFRARSRNSSGTLALSGDFTFTTTAAGAPGHVFIVLEENTRYSDVIGNSDMPYLNGLANQYGLATNYFADTHPSIGNYFMLTTGQIITNDDSFSGTVTEDNVVRQLLAAGKTWKSYAESLPAVGYTDDGPYPYARRHNPFAFLSDVINSPTQVNNLVPFSQFATDLANSSLPNYSFIVPNLINDLHDGTAAQADSWLQTNIAPLLASSVFQQDGILVIVFDESVDSDTQHGGGHVAFVVVGPKLKPSYRSTTLYQHESTLRMLMKRLGLTSFPGAAATAPDMDEFFLP